MSSLPTYQVMTGNQAAASMAYALNDMCLLYPITPSTEMSTLASSWSATGRTNLFGDIPETFEMQSEAGVAGALHGALQTGALGTTFTSSQGLLLMLPNLYKIAGELTPCVIHVATRAIATHALSVFGDHSDVMAVRQSGFGLLASASVQEAHDMALIAMAASLASRIPLIHFFDGFRVSHEYARITPITPEIMDQMISREDILAHRNRALNPDHPSLRGTAQGPDTYFPSREAQNPCYDRFPSVLQNHMEKFHLLTGRAYRPYEYYGHEDPTDIMVIMGAAFHTVSKAVDYLNRTGKRTGVINIRLFRPLSASLLGRLLTPGIRRIAVLDRTKEPGSAGEPLYLDVLQSVSQRFHASGNLPQLFGGRYGLASREFTPDMACDVFLAMEDKTLRHNFTVGIQDDLTLRSIPSQNTYANVSEWQEILLLENENNSTQEGFSTLMKLLGHTQYIQGYREMTYEKAWVTGRYHIRLSDQPIHAPYLTEAPGLIVCENINQLRKLTLSPGATILLTDPETNGTSFQGRRDVCMATFDDIRIATINTRDLPCTPGLSDAQNAAYHVIQDPGLIRLSESSKKMKTAVQKESLHASSGLFDLLRAGKGMEAPVSMFPADGSFPAGRPDQNTSYALPEIPDWDPDACTQCGLCSVVCPQAAIRMKVFEPLPSREVPAGCSQASSAVYNEMGFALAVNPDQCNGCNLCIEACPGDALGVNPVTRELVDQWKFVDSIPEFDRKRIDPIRLNQQQLQEPLFNYPRSVQGCAEGIYLKLLSQLFGDRLLIANSTGSSSILSGILPDTPWTANPDGQGPAWSNSLFEDTAEFGLGFRLSLDRREAEARKLLTTCYEFVDHELLSILLTNPQQSDRDIQTQREAVQQLKSRDIPEELLSRAQDLIRKSVWIVGGDGWAYDIGFGGLDHVISSGRDVNILVLDNELYSNTGGQQSKSTPFGATAALAPGGKKGEKKNLAGMMMQYGHAYIATIAIGADPEQTLAALQEAAAYDGPSLVIAYCHSPEHGVASHRYLDQHRLAVQTGQWPLYRYHPERTPRLTMDSSRPDTLLKEYLAKEDRFALLSPWEADKAQKEVLRKIDALFLRSAHAGHEPAISHPYYLQTPHHVANPPACIRQIGT